jgi:hypothetical protein
MSLTVAIGYEVSWSDDSPLNSSAELQNRREPWVVDQTTNCLLFEHAAIVNKCQEKNT